MTGRIEIHKLRTDEYGSVQHRMGLKIDPSALVHFSDLIPGQHALSADPSGDKVDHNSDLVLLDQGERDTIRILKPVIERQHDRRLHQRTLAHQNIVECIPRQRLIIIPLQVNQLRFKLLRPDSVINEYRQFMLLHFPAEDKIRIHLRKNRAYRHPQFTQSC